MNSGRFALFFHLLCVAVPAMATDRDPVPARGLAPVTEVAAVRGLSSPLSGLSCDWILGETLLERHPEWKAGLSRISSLDWYVGGELIREAQFLRWCRTEGLFPSRPVPDSFKRLSQGTQTVLYRYRDTVYVDARTWESLDPAVRPAFFLHALAQSYLPAKDPYRKARVASAVSALYQAWTGKFTTRASFHSALRKTGARLFLTANQLDPVRLQVEFALAQDYVRAQMIRNSKAPSKLADLSEAMQRHLSDWDYALLKPLKSLYRQALEIALAEASDEEYRKNFSDGRFSEREIAEASLSALDELSVEKREFLFQHPAFAGLIHHQLQTFSAAQISIQRGRAMASPFLQSLATYPALEPSVELSKLIPRQIGAEQMPVPEAILTLARSLATLARQAEWREVETYFSGNPRFYEALGLKAAMQTLRSAGHEKGMEQLAAIREGVIARFFHEASQKLGNDARQELYLRIQYSRFSN